MNCAFPFSQYGNIPLRDNNDLLTETNSKNPGARSCRTNLFHKKFSFVVGVQGFRVHPSGHTSTRAGTCHHLLQDACHSLFNGNPSSAGAPLFLGSRRRGVWYKDNGLRGGGITRIAPTVRIDEVSYPVEAEMYVLE
ncbi:hypothetical protein JTE90_020079 [Oedothorax gibbosus]|uniref:Uncharacterized protein n=1 Tax=Oedothorax gibbosus TaxID=931172 RepID=A0AAV6USH6_9ARAC|nr:hypothetical protein JTE90_020079 [Oedothorax gibbosus]